MDLESPLKIALAIFTFGTTLYFIRIQSLKRVFPRNLPLPPGPPRRFLLGSALELPTKNQCITYHEWAKEYGDVVYADAPRIKLIIIDTLQATLDLLEKRSAKYSSRPQFLMGSEVMGFNFGMVSFPYNKRWRIQHRIFHTHFHQGTVSQYLPKQSHWVRMFLRELLNDPEDFLLHSRRLSGAIIMDVTYGINTFDKNNSYISNADEVMRLAASTGLPGKYMVDFIPALKYVPAWMPGAEFQRIGEKTKRMIHDMLYQPLQSVKDRLASGDMNPCVASKMLEAVHPEEMCEIPGVAGIAYTAGADTTVSVMNTFFLAMLRYPEVQVAAQREIDAVIGQARLPEYPDRTQLPYVAAIVSEVLRWQPVTPTAIPHRLDMDDEYKGFLIPAGSIIIPNVWAILHDPEVYPDPEHFRPERFLKKTLDGSWEPDSAVQDPRIAAFGFGRRICPGRFFADQTLFLSIASVLALFDISPVLDEKTGEKVIPKVEMTSGVLACKISPRNAQTAELLFAY